MNPTSTDGLDDVFSAPTVFEAWSAVMGAVQSVSKDGRNQQQNFNFRGIDSVMNAVGPALRTHGVSVVPTVLDYSMRTYATGKNQTVMSNYVVTVRFEVFGPAGDSFFGVALGEAADAGDKAVSKAHSVAYRTFLLQALCIPTDEPDPDETYHEASDPTAYLVARIAHATSAWGDDDARRMTMREQAKLNGWPDRIGGYSLWQLAAAAELAERINGGDPFLIENENAGSTTNHPDGAVDVPTNPSTANAGRVDEQGSDGTSVVEPSSGPVNEGETT